MNKEISIIVIGSLNTDIVISGFSNFPKVSELILAKELKIGPGGKSRNVAHMIAELSPKNTVAMVSRTVRDEFGFWEKPLNALQQVSVNTEFIKIEDGKDGELPAIAIIPVDEKGKNKIYLVPGASEKLSVDDLNKADPLFFAAIKNNGLLALTLEVPMGVATAAAKRANKLGIKVILDPGGMSKDTDLMDLLNQEIFLLKPNEHEAEMISGVRVVDLYSAEKAAGKIMKQSKVQNVFITAGEAGGYLISSEDTKHIPVPDLNIQSTEYDETGCGDQTFAGIAVELQKNKRLMEACKFGVMVGTMQFYRKGIRPVKMLEINRQ